MTMVSSGFIQDYFDGVSAFSVQGSWRMFPANEIESDRIVIQTAVADLLDPGENVTENIFAIKLGPKPTILKATGDSMVPAQSAYADWLQDFVLSEYGRESSRN